MLDETFVQPNIFNLKKEGGGERERTQPKIAPLC